MTQSTFNLRHSRRGPNKPGMQSGQVIYLVISLIVILMGCASLAIDVGFLWGTRERMQTAADAAAVAASDSLMGGGSGNATTAGRASTAQNGFTNGAATAGNSNLVTVTVNKPPTSGAFTSNSQAIEVIVQQTQPSMFMSVMGISSVPVSARAVSIPSAADGCVYALDPSASQALVMTSSAQITSSCGVMVDSTASNAISLTSGAIINSTSVGAVGGVSNSGGTITPAPVTGIAAFPDPLASLPTPTVGTCVTVGNIANIGTKVTMNPGYYCSISVSASAQLTLNPGLYSLNGKLQVSSGASVVGNGVALYFKAGSLVLSSSGTVNLSAPTSGTYEGILIFEDRLNTSVLKISSAGIGTLTGALYLPDATINLSSAAFGNAYSILIADIINMSSSANMTINSDYSSLVDGSPIRRSVVAE